VSPCSALIATTMNLIRAALLCAALLVSSAPQAHLVLAQHGTVRIDGDHVYVAVSLPASAFTGFDDDGDGRMSTNEWDAHRDAMEAQVRGGLTLFSGSRALAMDGLLLSRSEPGHDADAEAQASHIVAQARFTLTDSAAPIALRIGLYGTAADERSLNVVVTKGAEKRVITFEPDRQRISLLPSYGQVFADCVRLGAEHILSGTDHLLFLLVVVFGGWGARKLILALTAFTLGHALTLSVSVFGGLSVPPNVVEPAIAVTIVAMAVLDRWSVQRKRPMSTTLRLALVFGCALIHGLGMASALLELGLDNAHRIVSLAGFNVGIEVAQVAVSAVVLGSLTTVRHLVGGAVAQAVTRIASAMAIAAGVIWFVQRV
jgi:hypothetical protein